MLTRSGSSSTTRMCAPAIAPASARLRLSLSPFRRLRQDEIADQFGGAARSLARRVAHDEGVRLAVEFVQIELTAAAAIGGGEPIGHVGGDIVVAGALHDNRR